MASKIFTKIVFYKGNRIIDRVVSSSDMAILMAIKNNKDADRYTTWQSIYSCGPWDYINIKHRY